MSGKIHYAGIRWRTNSNICCIKTIGKRQKKERNGVMTFLVTGATGFVGSSLIRALLHKGKDVRVLIRKDSDRTNLRV